MILAAGFGTRLKPITDTKPKALVKINGVPILDIVINKLISTGIENIVINMHHFAEQITEHINKTAFNCNINTITEKEILGTGGGIKNAERYLKDTKNFLLHNVDVISDIDLNKVIEHHLSNSPLVTLAVQSRFSSRPLLTDDNDRIIGNVVQDKEILYTEPAGSIKKAGFTGIHVISSEIFEHFEDTGYFDIFTSYFKMIRKNFIFSGFYVNDNKWMDAGSINDNYSFS